MSQKVYSKPAAHTGCWQIRVPLCFLMFFCISSGSARFALIFDSWSVTSSVQSAGHKDVIARWLTCIKNTWWTAWLILAFFHGLGIIDDTLPETNIAPWKWIKWMVGILLSFWDGLFSGAMLVSGRVRLLAFIQLDLGLRTRSKLIMANGNPEVSNFGWFKFPTSKNTVVFGENPTHFFNSCGLWTSREKRSFLHRPAICTSEARIRDVPLGADPATNHDHLPSGDSRDRKCDSYQSRFDVD